MSAPIIKHGEFSENYDDPAHPIPSITAIDINTVKASGGSDLIVIVAAPLVFDEKSQKRLMDKIDLYLRFIQTPEFEAESGVATAENTSIIFKLCPGSDPRIIDLIERCKPWVQANRATLRIEPLDAKPS
jgi:hypothetical protein